MADGAASANPSGNRCSPCCRLRRYFGLAEATGGDAAGRAAATTGFFFFAIGFFGGVSLLGWTASWQGGPLSRENLRGGEYNSCRFVADLHLGADLFDRRKQRLVSILCSGPVRR